MKKCIVYGVFALTLGTLAPAVPVNAGPVVYSQPPVNGTIAFDSVVGGQEMADNFTLAAATPITDLHWWGTYPGGVGADNFTINFFADNGSGSPAIAPLVTVTPVGLTRTATGLVDSAAFTVFEYNADLSATVPLNGSTTYYVSILNQGIGWGWAGDGAGQSYFRGISTNPWSTSTLGNRAFEVTAAATAVPEPSSLALLALAGAALASCRCARRRA